MRWAPPYRLPVNHGGLLGVCLRHVGLGHVADETGATYTRPVGLLRPMVSTAGLAAAILLALALAAPAHKGRAERSGVQRLVDDYVGSVSPDGNSIVFTRVRPTLRRGIDIHPVAQRSVVLLMRADGSRKRALRHPGARFEGDPTFSHDGRSILFVRDDRIFVMRRDGRGARPIRRDSLNQACPRFSPDGSMISLGAVGDGAERIS